MKQHTQTYKLTHVRRPVNFRMVAPKSSTARRSSGGEVKVHTYTMHALTRQQIKQNMSALPFESREEAEEEHST